MYKLSACSLSVSNTYRNKVYSSFRKTCFFPVIMFLSELFITLFNPIVLTSFNPITEPGGNSRRQSSRLLNRLCSPICLIKFRETIVISLQSSKLDFMDLEHYDFNYSR